MNINTVLPANTVMEENVIGLSQFRITVLEVYSFKNKKRKKGGEAKKLLVRQQLDCWDGLCAMEPSSICQHEEL